MKPYPQKPPLTDQELEAFLNSAPIARLGTLNPDGTIHLAALWFKYIDGEIVIGTQDKTSKIRNIKRNPNVASSASTPGASPPMITPKTA